jgi:hypothetical protein
MTNPDTQRMIVLVERQTGYRVTVDVIPGIHEHAQMISARPEAPAHLIRVNADHRQHADYIVAVQCGMLLVSWSDPTKVPGMAFEKAKCDYLAGKWAKTKQLAAFPADVAAKTANFHVESLLKQLHSTPLEIRVANLCHESCPSLRDMQAESCNAHLRSISEVFSPKIKQIAPPDAYQKNVAMNAALALNWARLSGSRLCLLPYESTGSRMKAERSRMKGSPVLNSSFFLLPSDSTQSPVCLWFWGKNDTLAPANDPRLFDGETELSLVA